MMSAVGTDDRADPLESMLLFHRSVRAALDTFDDIARLAVRGNVDLLKSQALYDFFTGPMRWHDHDERESLLRRLASREPARFGDALRESIAEHDSVERVVDEVLDHLRAIARRGIPDVMLLTRTADDLRRILEPHLEREERDVFEVARRVLTKADLRDMATEIAARRLRRIAAQPERTDS